MGSEVTNPHPLHILFFPLMAAGHTLPMVDIANLFAGRGVKVTILTTPANAPPIEAAVHSPGRCNVDLRIVPFPSDAVGLPEGRENLSTVSEDEQPLFIAATTMLKEPFRHALADLRPDAVLADTFFPWTLAIADELGIPRLVFHGTSIFSLCARESFLVKKPILLGEAETVVVIPDFPRRIELLRSQVPDLRKSGAFAEILEQIVHSERRSYGVVMNSFYELEPEFAEHYRTVVGMKTWHVGPVSLCNKQDDWSPRGSTAPATDHAEHCRGWLDGKTPKSVLYVCFGSLGTFTKDQLLELAVGLETCGHPFVWVLRQSGGCGDNWWPDGYMERIQGRGLILTDWAPQISILNHEAVGGFVTHCGWNSTLESVSAGVPMVTWPQFADQFYNERLVVDVLGIGVPVGAKQYTMKAEERTLLGAAEINKAIKRLMEADETEAAAMRARARELSCMAKKAVERGGSSYQDVGNLIRELTEARCMSKIKCSTKFEPLFSGIIN